MIDHGGLPTVGFTRGQASIGFPHPVELEILNELTDRFTVDLPHGPWFLSKPLTLNIKSLLAYFMLSHGRGGVGWQRSGVAKNLREKNQMFGSSIKKSAAVAFSACLMGFASHVSALDTSDSRYLGLINDGIPSSLENEVTYINILLAQPAPSGPTMVGTETYTRTANDCGGPCPAAVLAGAVKDESESNTVNLGTGGWTYLLGKYDASQAGAYVWYVGGLTGNQTIPSNLGSCGSSGCGLSHWSLFNPGGTPPDRVSEPGVLGLLGLGLVMVGFLRRRKAA